MKQHITHLQFQQLSSSTQRFNEEKYRIDKIHDKFNTTIPSEFWNIGQMIEFLCENKSWPIITMVVDGTARLQIPMLSIGFGKETKDLPSYELCDVLWKTVKEVLGK